MLDRENICHQPLIQTATSQDGMPVFRCLTCGFCYTATPLMFALTAIGATLFAHVKPAKTEIPAAFYDEELREVLKDFDEHD